MSMLDDPETAHYTHNLTVTGRLGGQYKCSVSNNKPSVATVQLTVAGNAFSNKLYIHSIMVCILQFSPPQHPTLPLTLLSLRVG